MTSANKCCNSHNFICNYITIFDHLLQTTWEEAGHAFQRTTDGDDLLSDVIEDTDGEGSQRAAALTGETVVLLHRVKHVLTHGVTDIIFIVALKACQSCINPYKGLIIIIINEI